MSFVNKAGELFSKIREWFSKPLAACPVEFKLDENKTFIFILMALFSFEILIYFFPTILAAFPYVHSDKNMAEAIISIMIVWCLIFTFISTIYLISLFPILAFFFAPLIFGGGIPTLYIFLFGLIISAIKFKVSWGKNIEVRAYTVFFLSILLFFLSVVVQSRSGILWPLATRDLPLVIGEGSVRFTEIVGLPFALIGSYPALIGAPMSANQQTAAQVVLFLVVAAIMLLVWARNLLSDSGGRVHPVIVFVAFYFFVSGLCAEIASHTVYARSFAPAISENGNGLYYAFTFFIATRRFITVIALAATIFLASGAKNYLSAESVPWTSNIVAQANRWAEWRVWTLIPWLFGLVLAATLLTQFWPEGLPVYVQDGFGLALAWLLMKFFSLPRTYRLICSRHHTAKQMWDAAYKPPALVPDDEDVERNL